MVSFSFLSQLVRDLNQTTMPSSSKRKRQHLQRRDSSDTGGASSQPQSRASSPAGDSIIVPQLSKRKKFDKRYKVSESTDAEVLSTFAPLVSSCFYSQSEFFLGMQQKTWSSVVYAHFDTPKIVRETGGVVRYVFSCKRSAVVLLCVMITSLTLAG